MNYSKIVRALEDIVVMIFNCSDDDEDGAETVEGDSLDSWLGGQKRQYRGALTETPSHSVCAIRGCPVVVQ